MNWLKNLYSAKIEGQRKVLTICGIKLKLKSKIARLQSQLQSVAEEVGFYSRMETLLNQNYGLSFLDNLSFPLTAQIQYIQSGLAYLFKDVEFQQFSPDRHADMYFSWGFGDAAETCRLLRAAEKNHKPCFLVEDGFLKSADTWTRSGINQKYQDGVSFILDDRAMYFDASRVSRLEEMLNDKTLIINEQQKQRAKKCIDVITSTCLTKYNHQPIYTPQIGRNGVPKVLVVDQSYNDMSVLRGGASDWTFRYMLASAISENPGADIIVKTHPDTLANQKWRSGYYVDVEPGENLYKLTTPINPIALLKSIDKVYVCTSQLGFEALMCGNEVHVFGMPFYAGWGLTKDRLVCSRRTHKRTLEEVFYIAYIMYTRYVSPRTQSRCEIEDAMNYLLDLRTEYFQEFGVRCEWDEALTRNIPIERERP